MPCYDGGHSTADIASSNANDAKREIKKIEAMLCAFLRIIEKQNPGSGLNLLFDEIDYKEAGVSRPQFEMWWSQHKIRDEARKSSDKSL